ncbi:MAG: uridine-cytidine kinase [Victivallaceae bacterium]|nr:uridine-cytidine kinase [Victivallaceae bacterium]
MAKKSNIILICGGSCSGKTTLAGGLVESMSDMGPTALISMDNYYYDLSGWDPAAADSKNFDSPDAVDSELLFRHLRDLQAHRKVRERRYDFKTHRICELDSYVKTADFIILEGIFTLYFEKLRKLAAAGIFVRADADIRLARRVERDIAVRRLPVEMVLRQYLNDVRPMHAEYIEPYGKYADLLLDSNFTSPSDNQKRAAEFLKARFAGL